MSVSSPPVTATAPFPYVGLLSLAGAIFVSVTSEFLPTGLLPAMARDLGVGISTAGYLVTIFAGTVVVATTPLAAVTQRFSRKSLIVVVLLVIAVANVLAAVAPTYGVLVAARIMGGLAHGLFWAVVAAYAAHLVPAHQLGKAVAITAGGGTAAFVLGVPVGTAIGNALGWRAAFTIIGVVVAILALVIVKFLPPVNHHVARKAGEERVPLTRDPSFRAVILLCIVILIILTGQNTFYTYIAPWLTDVSSFEPGSIALVLFLYGGAGIIGLIGAGYAADRFPKKAFASVVLVVMAAVLTLALVTTNTVLVLIAVIVWGAAFGGIPAMLQTRMLRTASFRTRDLSAALQTTAFNVGIGGGALLGGLLLDGIGLEVLPFVMILLVATGLGLSLATDTAKDRRERRRLRQE
ncbi:DHA1 family inner membrane transport protein [Arthrobacter sp. PL16]|uniref:MFS transporter n=1 Tax=Arthrobacter sp. PL16 TaxID=3071720 RepID=UPI002E0AC6A8|nr:DHA1 family inner membrane transport protein [Arthrobacter sp. PL16]